MIRLVAMLSRSLPLLILLILLAVGIYLFVSWRRSPLRAKEVLIKVFLVVCSALSIFLALVTLYAIVDGNMPVTELAVSCLVISVIGLLITLICRYRFKKHHPHYSKETTSKANVIENKPDMLDLVTKFLNFINERRPRK